MPLPPVDASYTDAAADAVYAYAANLYDAYTYAVYAYTFLFCLQISFTQIIFT